MSLDTLTDTMRAAWRLKCQKLNLTHGSWCVDVFFFISTCCICFQTNFVVMYVCVTHVVDSRYRYLSKQCESVYSFFQWESTFCGKSLRCFFPHQRVTKMRWFHRKRFVMMMNFTLYSELIYFYNVHFYLWKNEFFIKKIFRWF